MKIEKLLKFEGFKTVHGHDAILKAIKRSVGGSKKLLCSGYGVFPDGSKCFGCDDCKK